MIIPAAAWGSILENLGNLGGKKWVPLFQWTRQSFSIASTTVMYEPGNPLLDPQSVEGFLYVA